MQIVAQTAKFVRGAGKQSVFVLRVKQVGNPNFAFLDPGHPLHPYFQWLIDHPPAEAMADSMPAEVTPLLPSPIQLCISRWQCRALDPNRGLHLRSQPVAPWSYFHPLWAEVNGIPPVLVLIVRGLPCCDNNSCNIWRVEDRDVVYTKTKLSLL